MNLSYDPPCHSTLENQFLMFTLFNNWFQGSRLGLEHHLHRGRALAAFIHLLSLRVKKLKLEYETRRMHSDTSVNGQSNIQSDVHTLLSPITPDEESLLSSVRFTALIICITSPLLIILT